MTHIAILGCGGIARVMSRTLRGMLDRDPNALCMYATASRGLEKAQALADEFGFQKAYGSYEELVQDQNVDLVYIATPHSHHYEHIKLCLDHGKNVLCEKAFTVNAKQAREVCALAEKKGLLLTEAIWTRYMPARRIIDRELATGFLGKPVLLTANLCYPIDKVERIRRPELAGGALLDLGVYPLNFASMVLGDDLVRVDSAVEKMDTGVDWKDTIRLTYAGGQTAELLACAGCYSDRRGALFCEKGTLTVDNINNPQVITLQADPRKGGEYKEIRVPKQVTGYEYEVEACMAALREGRTECPDMPHSQTIRMMELMDSLRAQWGLRYPFEDAEAQS